MNWYPFSSSEVLSLDPGAASLTGRSCCIRSTVGSFALSSFLISGADSERSISDSAESDCGLCSTTGELDRGSEGIDCCGNTFHFSRHSLLSCGLI